MKLERGSPLSPSRRDLLVGAGATALGVALMGGGPSWADATSVLSPFDPSRPGGKAPQGLPSRIGALSPTPEGLNKSINDAIRQGAQDWDLEFISAAGNGTADSVVEQGTLLLNRGVGLFYSFVTNLEAEAPMLQRALDAGVNCANVAGYPCTMQINGSQTAAGTRQAQAAIKWIKEKGGGDARVAYLNNAKTAFLLPRDAAMRDAFAQAGIKLVADETPQTPTPDGGYATMSTLLQRYPDLNVVVGPFDVMGGAVGAMEAAGKTGDDIYMSVGNPTEAELSLIEKGSILRAGLVFPFEPMCYSLAKFAKDWLAGKSVPMGITVPGGNVLIDSSAGVTQYRKDISDLKALYNSDRFKIYAGYWGNTSYEEHAAHDWRQAWQPTNV